jgi:hypothetical protein
MHPPVAHPEQQRHHVRIDSRQPQQLVANLARAAEDIDAPGGMS